MVFTSAVDTFTEKQNHLLKKRIACFFGFEGLFILMAMGYSQQNVKILR
jgi:hypothetical protein